MLRLTAVVLLASGWLAPEGSAQVKNDPLSAAAKEIRVVFRIAPSISTGVEARKAIQKYRWEQAVDVSKADAIFVVVKTFGLRYPLDAAYPTLKELEKAAESQMNITGVIVHLYLYTLTNRGIVERAHVSYELNERVPFNATR